MNIVIASDSSNIEKRGELIGAYLKKKGHQVRFIESDFNHQKKVKGRAPQPDHIFVDAVPYYKNLSFRRLYSHHDFAEQVVKLILANDFGWQGKAELVYMLIPCNSLVKAAAVLKKQTGCRAVIDLVDLWPESLPVKGISWTPPIRYWKHLRDGYLKYADQIITECDLYQELLGLDPEKTVTLYWPKAEHVEMPEETCEGESIRIAYLGSINNIIDIPAITEILRLVNAEQHVELEIIGGGEKQEEFLSALKSAGIDYSYHGLIYEETEKQKILQSCEWGLNIMKPDVKVGLTMKSIDYMANGLKLINSIPGDTRKLVEERRIGVNFDGDAAKCAEEIVRKPRESYAPRCEIHNLYVEKFSSEAMEKRLDEKLGDLLNG